jgi:hypothetical protein
VLEGLLAAWADLEPDEEGQCTHLSLHFWFEAVPAFWY